MNRSCTDWWIVLAATFCVVQPIAAADLRPFVLPSQNAATSPVQQRTAGVSNAFYQNFARDVTQMDQKKIDSLRTDFQNKLAQAKSNKRDDELAHYERMLGILATYGQKTR